MPPPRIPLRVPCRPRRPTPPLHQRQTRSATTHHQPPHPFPSNPQPSWSHDFVTKTARYTFYTLPFALCLLPWLPYTTVAVNGQSMTPLLSPAAHGQGTIGQDILLVRPATHLHLYADPKEEGGSGRGVEGVKRKGVTMGLRGAVVVFRTPHAPEREGVKRVVAVEGDTVVVRPEFRHRWRSAVESGQFRGQVIPLSSQSRGTPSGCPYPGTGSGEDFQVKVSVPFGHVWVEGENPAQSRDSNDYGPISKALIQGVAVGIVSPRERWNLNVGWEQDGWRERWRARGFQWTDEGKTRQQILLQEIGVPEEWAMHN